MPKKICIMHRASIGDVLLATPVHRAIKECYPDCEVVAVTSYEGYEMLKGNPCIDRLLPYENGDPILHVIRAIWRADAALIFDIHYRNALFAFLAGIPVRIGWGRHFLTTRVKDEYPLIFAAEKYMSLARLIGVEGRSLRPLQPMASPEEKRRIADIVEQLKAREKAKKIAVIVPYSLSELKNWPVPKYAEIIERLKAHGYASVIMGGKEHYERAERDFPDVMNLTGKTNLRESAEFVAHSDLQICGCTAMLHICSTTDTPVVAIYGPTSPIEWAPRNNCTVVSHMLDCSPCYNKNRAPCTDPRCIREIGVEEVWKAVLGRMCS